MKTKTIKVETTAQYHYDYANNRWILDLGESFKDVEREIKEKEVQLHNITSILEFDELELRFIKLQFKNREKNAMSQKILQKVESGLEDIKLLKEIYVTQK